MLNLASYGGTDIVVTRFTRPEVAVIDYEKYQQLRAVRATVPRKKAVKDQFRWLVDLHIKGGPKDLSLNHDKYLYGQNSS
jgi:hypothetical protein